jgi:tRNA pseudouridine55 synthase
MSSGLHGYVIIDKPAGWTSHDVVAKMRRLLGERKIGHAGTLDPAATGVLPLAVGDATRTLEYLADDAKTYLAEITFGVETDSYDADGVVTSIGDATRIDRSRVEAALASMIGPQEQVPPMHSAIKIGGKRLYETARRGETVERPPRPVTFYALDLVDWNPPVAQVCVDCSKGTYVRSLAFDLGSVLGSGAHLSGLVRLRTGPFELADAWTISELQRLADQGEDVLRWCWNQIAHHPDASIQQLPVLVLDDDGARRWHQGGTVQRDRVSDVAHDAGPVRTYDAGGNWIGIGAGAKNGDGWAPTKVVAPASGKLVNVEADSRV